MMASTTGLSGTAEKNDGTSAGSRSAGINHHNGHHALQKITREELIYKMSVMKEKVNKESPRPRRQIVFLFLYFALMMILCTAGIVVLVSAGQLAHPLEAGSTPGWPAFRRLFAGNEGINWFATNRSGAAPAFADLDSAAARTYDIVIGSADGTVGYYANSGQSVPSMNWLENSSNATGAPISPSAPTAVNGSPAVADLNGDGLLDIAIGIKTASGGTDTGNITFWSNTGTASNPQWTQTSSWWISTVKTQYTAGVGFTNYSMGSKWDLVVGNNTGYVYVQLNNGTTGAPSWTTSKILLMQIGSGVVNAHPAMANVYDGASYGGAWDLVVGLANGSVFAYSNQTTGWYFQGAICREITSNFSDNSATPSFYDMDGDGLKDLLVGSGRGYVYFYNNTGTATSPTWTYVSRTLFNAGAYAVPAPGDFNGDGKADLLLGYSGTTLYYYTGYPNATEVRVWSAVVSDLLAGSGGTYAKPKLLDFDNDGDLDMIVGNGNGDIKYYRNDGTTSSPSYTFVRNFLNWGTNASPALGDINYDGNYEMMIGNSSSYLSRFDSVPPYNVNGISPQWVGDLGNYSSPALVDIDGDTDLDVVVGRSDGKVFFIENFGNSTNPLWNTEPILWVTASTSKVPTSSPYAVPAFADIDNDGDYDLFVGVSDGNVSFYRNSGTATNPSWTFVQNYPLTVNDRAAPAFADLNNDGKIDILVGDAAGDVRLFMNIGTAWNASWNYSGNTTVISNLAGAYVKPTIADMDGDGDKDLVVGRGGSAGDIRFYNNTGNATNPSFTYYATWLTVNDDGTYSAPALGDLNGDGKYDMVVGESRGWIRAYMNNGTSAIPSWNSSIQYWLRLPGTWTKAELVDFDGDGDLDMVLGRDLIDPTGYFATDGYGSYITYFRNDNNAFTGVMNWTRTTDLGYIPGPSAFGSYDNTYTHPAPTLADMDGDEDLDMAWGTAKGFPSSTNGTINYFQNVANQVSYNWTLLSSDLLNNGTFGGGYATPFFFDFDGDGDRDLIMGADDGYIRYFRNGGNSTYANFSYVRRWFGNGGAAVVADMTYDGWPDVITVDAAYSTNLNIYVYTNDASHNSSINLTLNTSQFIAIQGSPKRLSAAFGDLNNDGMLDMVVGMGNGSLWAYRNDGTASNPNMTLNGTISASLGTYVAPELADMDGDGDLDLLFGNASAYIGYYRNDGTASAFNFTFVTSDYLGSTIKSGDATEESGDPQAADINGDGRKELVIFSLRGAYEWRNDTTTNLWTYVGVAIGDGGCGGSGADHCYLGNLNGDLADVTGDGLIDLIAGDNVGRVRLYRNTGTSTSPTFSQIYAGDGGDAFVPNVGYYCYVYCYPGATPKFVDLNGDGKKDLIVGNYTSASATLRFYVNNGPYTGAQLFDYPTWTEATSSVTFDDTYTNAYYKGLAIGRLDEDQDLDLVGAALMFSGSWFNGGKLQFIRNDGSISSPGPWNGVSALFKFTNGNYNRAGVAETALMAPKPFLYDMDGDGDLDMIVGDSTGHVYYFLNNGTATSPSFLQVYAGSLGKEWLKTDVGSYAAPAVADLNGDGTLELIVGNSAGYLQQFNNSGIYTTRAALAENPAWIWTTTNYANAQNLLSGALGSQSYYLVPEFIKVDGDGKYDIVVGKNDDDNSFTSGRVAFINNTGTNTTASWANAVQWVTTVGIPAPIMTDVDGDGNVDLFVGDIAGNMKYYRNSGNFSWQYVYAGNNGTSYLPNSWDYSYLNFTGPVMEDIDGDGRSELCITESDPYNPTSGEMMYCLTNYGQYSTDRKKADHATWILANYSMLGNSIYPGETKIGNGAPAFGDLDGDGDLDLVVGMRYSWSSTFYSLVGIWKNNGSKTVPSWSYNQTLVSNGGDNFLVPTLADFDLDGDLDLAVGNSSGGIRYYMNQKDPKTVLALLRGSDGTPVTGATVSFSNQTTAVCSGVTTDSNGKAMCYLPNPGDNITLSITGASAGGTVQVDVGIPDCQGHTSMILDMGTSAAAIILKKMTLNVYTPDQRLGDSVRVLITDYGSAVFRGRANGNGTVTAFLPERYIVNKGEPFTQRRVTYDVSLLKGADYAHNVTFSDVYVPNTINISSAVEDSKFFKFGAARQGATDSQYKMYLIYPAVRAQKKFNITEYINSSFSFVGNVSVYYIGNWSCTVVPQAAASFNVTYTNCSTLTGMVMDSGDWLVASYTIQTPSGADAFLVDGGGIATYTFPAPLIRLYT